MQKTSHPYDASELSTDDGSRKRRKAEEVIVGERFSDYLLPCPPYGDINPKQREFEGNVVPLMAHVFTSLLMVDHDCFRILTQDLDPQLHPIEHSKISRSLIPTENQSAERSVIERLAKVKAILISYDLWMSRNTEEIFSLTSHYCTIPERKNTHIGMPSTTTTDGVSLYLYVMEVVDEFSLESNIVGITNDGGINLRVCR